MECLLLKEKILRKEYDDKLKRIYGENKIEHMRQRYVKSIENFISLYGERDVEILSVPGRSEIIGNHTDHNHGCVLAAAVNIDIIAVVSKSLLPGGTKSHIRIKSEGFDPDDIDIENLSPVESEKFTSAAIIRGICHKFIENGYTIGGFDAYTTSDILKGSGLSSSAAFEVMTGYILNHLYNDNKILPVEIAKIGQYAENNYFGKPCGLMDQTTCSVGGFVAIDFNDPKEPVVEKLDYNLTKAGYSLCILSTGGSHADLNDEYAAITKEMKQVAKYFGKETLRDIKRKDVNENIIEIRKACGDRAILRAFHYFAENGRVKVGTESLKEGQLDVFLNTVTSSGNSSFKYLQNIYANKMPHEQSISLALAVCEEYLANKDAAYRVHGGGFAGTVQIFIPKKLVGEFIKYIENIFGEGSCLELSVREHGAMVVV